MSERDQGQTKTAETSDQRAESTAEGCWMGKVNGWIVLRAAITVAHSSQSTVVTR